MGALARVAAIVAATMAAPPADVRLCSRHPERPATYVCDGCERPFCDECVVESHALFLCPECGERALPVVSDRAASPRQPGYGSPGGGKPGTASFDPGYRLRDAFAYPFRGSGISMFLALLVSTAFVAVVGWVSCFASLALSVGLTFLITALQLKIVRTTARGDDELPDWPDWIPGELVRDLATWLFVQLLQWILVAPFVFLVLSPTLFSQANLGFWVGFTVCLWLGSGLSLMGLGAAGALGRMHVVAVVQHVRAFLYCGRDAIDATNIAFFLGGLVFLARFALESIPFYGGMLGSALGAYWLFVIPHVAGVVFRRHRAKLEQFYGDTVY